MGKENNLINEFMEEIEDIRFITVDTLFINKKYIKARFNELNGNVKEMYKWYFFYQLCLLKNPLKSLFWDYITKENDDVMLESELSKEYFNFCNKRKKIRMDNLTKM